MAAPKRSFEKQRFPANLSCSACFATPVNASPVPIFSLYDIALDLPIFLSSLSRVSFFYDIIIFICLKKGCKWKICSRRKPRVSRGFNFRENSRRKRSEEEEEEGNFRQKTKRQFFFGEEI